jgi:hypothetical protein
VHVNPSVPVIPESRMTLDYNTILRSLDLLVVALRTALEYGGWHHTVQLILIARGVLGTTSTTVLQVVCSGNRIPNI